MRDFLYRGKRLDNGEWIEGYLFVLKRYSSDADHYYILPVNSVAYDSENRLFDLAKEVDPTTVGQYTGGNAKGDVKIFEGDILEGCGFSAEDDGCGVVTWNDGAFEVENSLWCGTFHENYYSKEFEVVGNVHDNPELLPDAN